MSALAYAREFRPNKFADILGNTRLVEEMRFLLAKKALPATIMFTGEQSTGKTTLAKLLAKALVCTNLQADGNPCDQCAHCQAMNQSILTGEAAVGIPMWLQNISKLNKVEDIDLLIDNMRVRGLSRENRVFILDEMQVATPQAQARLLQICEEPLDDLYIIMTTTNPERLSKPLKSRFIEYKLHKPKVEDLVNRLAEVAVKEGIDYSKSALAYIVTAMDCNFRESLNQMQVLADANDHRLDRQQVFQHLNIIPEKIYVSFLAAVLEDKLQRVTNTTVAMKEAGLEVGDFMQGFSNFLVELINVNALVNVATLTPTEVTHYRKLAKALTDRQLTALFKVTNEYLNYQHYTEFHLYAFAGDLITALQVPAAITTPTETEVPTETTAPVETAADGQESQAESSTASKERQALAQANYDQLTNDIKTKDTVEGIQESGQLEDLKAIFGDALHSLNSDN